MAVEILLGIVFLLLAALAGLAWWVWRLRGALRELAFGKQSLAVKYGKMSEQFFPFMKDYPYSTENFRFLGTPIDGVQFEKDRVVFVEFKAGSSGLSARQKEIKELVERKKVEFEEVRIS